MYGVGSKQVFRNNVELNNNLSQIAYGIFNSGEECEEHLHQTKYEYFFFIRGQGIYTVNGQEINLEEGVFLEIPPKTKHSLKAIGNKKLEFIYWGVAV